MDATRMRGGRTPPDPVARAIGAVERARRGLLALPVPPPAAPRRVPAPRPAGAPVLLFAPHPDDESLVGGLPLRLRRQAGIPVVAVAVTLGSDPARRPARLREMRAACARLGFGLALPRAGGLAGVTLETRRRRRRAWARMVEAAARLVARHHPRAVFLPHADDGHPTHAGVHRLVVDALASLGDRFEGLLVETEYWRPMRRPNLLVESGAADVADLVAAVASHAGEVARNPYHATLPAWLQDNVRRGAELVGRPGGSGAPFAFGTLYRVRRWRGGRLRDARPPCPWLLAGEDAAAVLGCGPPARAGRETAYLLSLPGMRASIRRGLRVPLRCCSREPGW